MQRIGMIFIFLLFQLINEGSAILTKLNCRTSGNGTCTDPFCFVTPINSTTASANFGCGNLARPLNQIKIRQEFYFKFFNNFIPFNIFPDIEYCSFIKKPNKNSFFYAIVDVLKAKVPGLIHQCPYQGKDLQIRNLALTVSDLALWITGEYKLIYTFFDDFDKRILQVSARGVIGRRQ